MGGAGMAQTLVACRQPTWAQPLVSLSMPELKGS